jgi:hypothetical protein
MARMGSRSLYLYMGMVYVFNKLMGKWIDAGGNSGYFPNLDLYSKML